MSPKRKARLTVGDVISVFERIAPPALAQEWDNVGLLAGHPDAVCRKILCCIDMTGPVLDEADTQGTDLVLAYHPPLFRPIRSLRGDSGGTESLLWRAVASGMAVYSMHTALDAAEGGTNDVLAELAGLTDLEPFEFVDENAEECKLVTFVPPGSANRVAAALAEAGAGQIGNYSQCSFRSVGQGTFFGDETTDPTIGRKGRLERVDEIRLEVVVPSRLLADVCRALRTAHPYEEPAYDVYPLRGKPVRSGIGRCGRPTRGITLAGLARKLRKAIGSKGVQIVGAPETVVRRAAVCVGAAGTLPLELPRSKDCDCIITGEIRHHDALTILRRNKTAVALSHWASERPVLPVLAKRIRDELSPLTVRISRADADPLTFL